MRSIINITWLLCLLLFIGNCSDPAEDESSDSELLVQVDESEVPVSMVRTQEAFEGQQWPGITDATSKQSSIRVLWSPFNFDFEQPPFDQDVLLDIEFGGGSKAVVGLNKYDMDYLRNRGTIIGYKIYFGSTLNHEVGDASRDMTEAIIRFDQNGSPLVSGKQYFVGVKMVNSLQEISVTSTSIPIKVDAEGVFEGYSFAGITSVESEEHGKATVKWEPAAWISESGNPEEGLKGYRIYTGTMFETLMASVDKDYRDFTVSNLPAGSEISFGIRSVDGQGNEDTNMKTISKLILDLEPPQFEGIFVASYDSDLEAVVLRWNRPLEKVNRYTIYYAHDQEDIDWDTPYLEVRGKTTANIEVNNVSLQGDQRIGDEWFYYFGVRAEDMFENMDTNVYTKRVWIPDIKEPIYDGLTDAYIERGVAILPSTIALGGVDHYDLFIAEGANEFNFLGNANRQYKLLEPGKVLAAEDEDAGIRPLYPAEDGKGFRIEYESIRENITFKFVTRAVDAKGKSSQNKISYSVITDDLTPPDFDGISDITWEEVDGNFIETALRIWWEPSEDQNTGAQDVIEYRIYITDNFGILNTDADEPAGTKYIGTPEEGNPIRAEVILSELIPGLRGDREYCFVVAAVDDAGNYSINVSGTNPSVRCKNTPDATPPEFGGVAMATQLIDGWLRLEWFNDNPDDVAKFLIFVSAQPIKNQPKSYFYNPEDITSQNYVSIAGYESSVELNTITDTTSNYYPEDPDIDGTRDLIEGLTYYLMAKAVDAADNVDSNTLQITFKMADKTPPNFTPQITNCDTLYNSVKPRCASYEATQPCDFEIEWNNPGTGSPDAADPDNGGIDHYLIWDVTGIPDQKLGQVGKEGNVEAQLLRQVDRIVGSELMTYGLSTRAQGTIKLVIHSADKEGNEQQQGAACTVPLPDRQPPYWICGENDLLEGCGEGRVAGDMAGGNPGLNYSVATDPPGIIVNWRRAIDDGVGSGYVYYILYKTSASHASNQGVDWDVDNTVPCTPDHNDPDDPSNFIYNGTCIITSGLLNDVTSYYDQDVIVNGNFVYGVRTKDGVTPVPNMDSNTRTLSATTPDIFAPILKTWVIEPVGGKNSEAISMYWYIEDIPKANQNITVNLWYGSNPNFTPTPEFNINIQESINEVVGADIPGRYAHKHPETDRTSKNDFYKHYEYNGHTDPSEWAYEYNTTLGKVENCAWYDEGDEGHPSDVNTTYDCTWALNDEDYPLRIPLYDLTKDGYRPNFETENPEVDYFDTNEKIYFRMEVTDSHYYDDQTPVTKFALSYPIIWDQHIAMAFIDKDLSKLRHHYWIDKYEAYIPGFSWQHNHDPLKMYFNYIEAEGATKYNWMAQSKSGVRPTTRIPVSYDDDVSNASKQNHYGTKALPYETTLLACELRGQGYTLTDPKQWTEAARGTRSWMRQHPEENKTSYGYAMNQYECNVDLDDEFCSFSYGGLKFKSQYDHCSAIRKTGSTNSNASLPNIKIAQLGSRGVLQVIGPRCVSTTGVHDMIGNASEYVLTEIFAAYSGSNLFISGINPFTRMPDPNHYLSPDNIVMDYASSYINENYENNIFSASKIMYNPYLAMPDFRIGDDFTYNYLLSADISTTIVGLPNQPSSGGRYVGVKNSSYRSLHYETYNPDDPNTGEVFVVESIDFTTQTNHFPSFRDTGGNSNINPLKDVGFRCAFTQYAENSDFRPQGSKLTHSEAANRRNSGGEVLSRCRGVDAVPYNKPPVITGFSAYRNCPVLNNKYSCADEIYLDFQVTDDLTLIKNLEIFIYKDRSNAESPNSVKLSDYSTKRASFVTGTDLYGNYSIDYLLEAHDDEPAKISALPQDKGYRLIDDKQPFTKDFPLVYVLFVRDESCAISRKEVMVGALTASRNNMVPVGANSMYNGTSTTFWIDREEQTLDIGEEQHSNLNYYEAFKECAMKNLGGGNSYKNDMPGSSSDWYFRLASLSDWGLAASGTPTAPPLKYGGPGVKRNYGPNQHRSQLCYTAGRAVDEGEEIAETISATGAEGTATTFCSSYYSAKDMYGIRAEWVDMILAYNGISNNIPEAVQYGYNASYRPTEGLPRFKVGALGTYRSLGLIGSVFDRTKAPGRSGLPTKGHTRQVSEFHSQFPVNIFDNLVRTDKVVSGTAVPGTSNYNTFAFYRGNLALQTGGAMRSAQAFNSKLAYDQFLVCDNDGCIRSIGWWKPIYTGPLYNSLRPLEQTPYDFTVIPPMTRKNMIEAFTSTAKLSSMSGYRCVWGPPTTDENDTTILKKKYQIVSLAVKRNPTPTNSQMLIMVQIAPEYNEAIAHTTEPINLGNRWVDKLEIAIFGGDCEIEIDEGIPEDATGESNLPRGMVALQVGRTSNCKTGPGPYGKYRKIKVSLKPDPEYLVDETEHTIFASVQDTKDIAASTLIEEDEFDMAFIPKEESGVPYDYYIDRFEAYEIAVPDEGDSSELMDDDQLNPHGGLSIAGSKAGTTPITEVTVAEARKLCVRRANLFNPNQEGKDVGGFPGLIVHNYDSFALHDPANFAEGGDIMNDIWTFRLTTNQEWYAAAKGVEVHGKDRFLVADSSSQNFLLNGANTYTPAVMKTGYRGSIADNYPDTISAVSNFGVWNMGGNVREFVDLEAKFTTCSGSCKAKMSEVNVYEYWWGAGDSDTKISNPNNGGAEEPIVITYSGTGNEIKWEIHDEWSSNSYTNKGELVKDVFSRFWLPAPQPYYKRVINNSGIHGGSLINLNGLNEPYPGFSYHYYFQPVDKSDEYHYDGNYFIIPNTSDTIFRIGIRGGSHRDHKYRSETALKTDILSPSYPLYGVHTIDFSYDSETYKADDVGFRCVMVRVIDLMKRYPKYPGSGDTARVLK